MIKLLTEKQMWLKIAHIWKTQAGNRKGGGWGIYIRKRPAIMSEYLYGLCNVLATLQSQCAVSVYRAVNRKIKAAVGKASGNEWPYAWPTTKAGAKPRIAFCLKQARLCKEKKRCRKIA